MLHMLDWQWIIVIHIIYDNTVVINWHIVVGLRWRIVVVEFGRILIGYGVSTGYSSSWIFNHLTLIYSKAIRWYIRTSIIVVQLVVTILILSITNLMFSVRFRYRYSSLLTFDNLTTWVESHVWSVVISVSHWIIYNSILTIDCVTWTFLS